MTSPSGEITAFTAARVHSLDGGPTLREGSVIVAGGRVVRVAPAAEIPEAFASDLSLKLGHGQDREWKVPRMTSCDLPTR